jgi:hypothetical protein
MATNRKPLLDLGFTNWVATLSTAPTPASRIWCDECHYWHDAINECAYVTKDEVRDDFLLNAWEDCMRSARNIRGHQPARHAWLLDQARQLRTSLLALRKAGA